MTALAGLRGAASGPLRLQRSATKPKRLVVRRQASYASDATFPYDVQTGETLASIAERYGVSVHELKELNYGKQAILKSSAVTPGQRVLLPARLADLVAEQRARPAQATVSVSTDASLGMIVKEAIGAHVWILQGAGALLAGFTLLNALLQMVTKQAATVGPTLSEAKKEISRAEASLEAAERVRHALASAATAPISTHAPTALKKTTAIAALPEGAAGTTVSTTAAVTAAGDSVVKATAAGGAGASGSAAGSTSTSSSPAAGGSSSAGPQPPNASSSGAPSAAGAAAAVSMAVAAAVVPGGRRDVGAEKAVAAVAAEAEVIVAPLPPVTSPILTPLPTPVVAAAVPTPPPSPRQAAATVATAQPQQRAVHHNHVVPINLRVSSPMAASVAASAGLTSSSSPAAAAGSAGSRTRESSPPLPSSGGGSSPRGGSTSPRPSPTPQTSSSSGNSAFDIIAALNRAWQSSSNRGSTPSASGRSPTPPNLPSIMPSPSLAGKSLISLKSDLLDLVYGTARGVSASGEQRAAIEEHITALEARNPNPRPTEALGALSGRWKLVYTSSTQTLLLLNALDALPLVDIGDVYQVIDAERMVAYNKIDIAVPVLVSLTAETGFEVRTPRAFKVRFTKVGVDTYISTPKLLASLDIPASVTVLGTTIDLAPLKRLIVDPVNAGLETAQAFLQKAVTPEFPVEVSEATSLWMLTTYLDDTLRISRDDTGHVYVMLKDTSLYRVEMEESAAAH